MRDILFRGKKDRFNEWVYGDLELCDSRYDYVCIKTMIQRPHSEMKEYYLLSVIPDTIGQYTGLKDKNGNKIFEGDIIRYADLDEYEYYLESKSEPELFDPDVFKNMWTYDEIVYCIACSYPAFDLNRNEWDVNGLAELANSEQYFYEVIGNIYDNPELLEVENEKVD